MSKTQSYIGIPNGVVLCIDHADEHEFSGRYYHSYSTEEKEFHSEEQLLFDLENFFNQLRFPFASTNTRSFVKKKEDVSQTKERIKVMSDEELLSRHGDLGTFIIRVQQRQNSSWQGRITWVDEDKTVYFRSVWEMMKLIDSAVDTYVKDNDDEPSW